MPVIRLDRLSKRYGALQALDGVSLAVPQGCLYGLLGPNGAGKTTCLRILCTLLAPDAGQVSIAGIDALADPRAAREQLGYVAQEVAIDKILSGRELLELQASLYHLGSVAARRRIDELTELLGMAEWLDRRCGTYSGGMRRRLDLACGLLHSPAVLVLDEPTVGLDIESRAALWQVLQDLRDGGTTVLLSSHYLEEVDALADRLAILDGGRVIAEGTPDDLKRELGGDRVTLRVKEFATPQEAQAAQGVLQQLAGVRQVVINRAQGHAINLVMEGEGAALLERLRQQLDEASVPVFSLAQSRPSLDDVYLQATGRTLMDAELASVSSRDAKAEKKQAMR
ncbi:MAG: ABC transporter ATP-binding protein [Synechococcus sp. MED-G71]|nr:MAG: ABC transporter ATP-binding protein [Synechococcus sp. MED-G71]